MLFLQSRGPNGAKSEVLAKRDDLSGATRTLVAFKLPPCVNTASMNNCRRNWEAKLRYWGGSFLMSWFTARNFPAESFPARAEAVGGDCSLPTAIGGAPRTSSIFLRTSAALKGFRIKCRPVFFGSAGTSCDDIMRTLAAGCMAENSSTNSVASCSPGISISQRSRSTEPSCSRANFTASPVFVGIAGVVQGHAYQNVN